MITSNISEKLVKSYSDRTYKYTAMVTHKGTLIAFAMDDQRQIFYTVLDLDDTKEGKEEFDVAYWSDNPSQIQFPGEIGQVGYSLVGSNRMPTVKIGTRDEVANPSELLPEEVDRFLSTTARLTADAPFQVFSDNQHIFLFRQAITDDHQDAVYKLATGAVSGDNTRPDSDFSLNDGNKVPIVDCTLLCDRFVLSGKFLQPNREVRYQRSRHKTRPANQTDSLAAKDMEGNPFFEPTQELAFICNLENGSFTVLQLPTQVQGIKRWQLFAHNSSTERIDSFNFEVSDDGLFNLQGTQLYSSPDPQYRSAVLERSPGNCPFTNLPLVPVTSKTNYAETALEFDGSGDFVELPASISSEISNQITVEAWVYCNTLSENSEYRGIVTNVYSGSGNIIFELYLNGSDHRLNVGFHDGSWRNVSADSAFPMNQWVHVAGSYDGVSIKCYQNGSLIKESENFNLSLPSTTNGWRIGRRHDFNNPSDMWNGRIDEVRIWNYARSQHEIDTQRDRRLIGNEPGLVGYWRFDEGSGNTVFDQTDNCNNGTINGDPQWVASDAPVGDHPGMRRSSFTLSGRSLVGGLSSRLYYQQEKTASGYDANPKPMKKNARVMLAAATTQTNGTETATAALDFAVSKEGRLAQVPDTINLPVLEKPEASSNISQMSTLEGEIRSLNEDIELLDTKIAEFIAGDDTLPSGDDIWLTLEGLFLDGKRSGYLCINEDGKVKVSNDFSSLASHWKFDYNSDDISLKNRSKPNYHMALSQNHEYLFTDNAQYDPLNLTDQLTLVKEDNNLYRLTIKLNWITPPFYTGINRYFFSETEIGVKQNFIFAANQSDLDVYQNMFGNSSSPRIRGLKELPLRWRIRDARDTIAFEQRKATRTVKKQQLKTKQEELGLLSGETRAEIRLPMGLVHCDTSGLTVNGGLLKFAPGEDTPFLLDSATGDFTLYYQNAAKQFMATYFDTLVSRAKFNCPGNSVTLLARAAGSNNATATVSDGSSEDTCNLVITNSDRNITETWSNLPRNSKQFAEILNGQVERPDTVTVAITPAIYNVKERSLQVIAAVSDTDGTVSNGDATALSGQDSRWSADAPGRAYYFKNNTTLLSLPNTQLEQTAMDSNLTVEAWINPSSNNDGTVRLLHHCSDKAAYTLALQEATPKQSALNFDGSGDYVTIKPSFLNNLSTYTLEGWVKPSTHEQVSLFGQNDVVEFGTDSSGKLSVWRNNESVTDDNALPLNTWSHVAVVEDESNLILYVNGTEVKRGKKPTSTTYMTSKDPFQIGAGVWSGGSNHPFTGDMDEIRVWNKARSASEIQADLDRRLYGNESGLIAYYTFENGEARDRGPNGYHGIIHGNPTVAETAPRLKTYHLVAGVSYGTEASHNGQRFLKSKETLPSEQWHHIALRFNQSYGLQFNGNSYLNCGNNQMLDIAEDLTIEAFVQLNSFSATQGLIGKGFLGEDGKSVPYHLKVGTDKKLKFAFEDADGGSHSYSSTSGLTAGNFHRVAVTRKKGRTQEEKTGNRNVHYKDPDGKDKIFQVTATESAKMKEWFDITFYIDGEQCSKLDPYDGQAPLGNDGVLEIGRTQSSPRNQQYTQGIISEVRLWNTAREKKDIGKQIQGNESGLVSWWQFEDNEGNVATDSKSSNHGKIRGAKWVKNPDPKGGAFNFLWNGLPMAADSMTSETAPAWGDSQFSLAGYKNGSTGDLFKGILEEVRIWRTLRTEEQISDNLFTRLKGEKQDLLAYYTFDDPSNESQANRLNDNSLRGNHLPLPESEAARPDIVISTAPISNDTAAVRSALAGVDTPFHEQIDSTPAVQEYADLQRDSQGNMGGVLKRCYSYLQNGHWQLVTGYKVGNLVTEWIGQAQFDPQVIGYIEGSPPVPSENLTEGNLNTSYEKIEKVSKIDFVESETVNYSLSSSKQGSTDMGFKAAAEVTGGTEVWMITAPLGFGTATQLVDVDFTAGLQGNFDTSNQWSQEESLGTSINRTRSMSVALGGSLEGAGKGEQANPAVGRRVIPGNKGFALVQSQTADIFALRLAHNNALVSFRMMPNPDIPIDWNIIPFDINPRYTKQGTLDGRIGYGDSGAVVLDESYPNAHGYGEYSYFKPKETYAIEKRIQREEQRLLNYYQSFDTSIGRTGQVIGAAAGASAGILASAVGGAVGGAVEGIIETASSSPSLNLPKKFAKRNLVNTYVWTADGGFFAETTETTDVKSEVTAGSFSFSGAVGGTFGFSIDAPVGISLEFEAAIGGSMNITKTRAKDTEKSFSLAVDVDVPGDLQKTEPDASAQFWKVPSSGAVTAAGKVDAYRFKTFYLDSSERNFEDLFGKVIDPIWLAGDTPNAVALRQANQGDKKPPCWRIFHRVTFVSRILPEFQGPVDAPLEIALKAKNIDSNWQLIQKLDPFVRNHTQDSVAFSDAVRKAIESYLPELEPHTNEIIKYLKLYYGISV